MVSLYVNHDLNYSIKDDPYPDGYVVYICRIWKVDVAQIDGSPDSDDYHL